MDHISFVIRHERSDSGVRVQCGRSEAEKFKKYFFMFECKKGWINAK